MSNTPIGRIKFKHEGVNYSVVTIWQGDKGISISLDKNSEKYPAMNPIAVFKKWANGEGFLNYFPADAPQKQRQTIDGPRVHDDDPFGDDGSVPF